jgi:hypothetical protein
MNTTTVQMDVSRVDYHQPSTKVPSSEAISLESDSSDSELTSAIAMQQRGAIKVEVQGETPFESGDEEVDDETDDDELSWDGEGQVHYDHNLEELGDEVVLGGGEYPETP